MNIFLRQKILIAILALGVILVASPVLAVGISVGYPNAIPLTANENLYYGASTGTLGNLILLQVDSSPKFRVDATGNIYIGPGATPICTSSGCTSTGGATGDNLGNHTAITNLNMNDSQLQNVLALQLKDWDDNTGGTDSKYRLLARDGAWQFYNGGVVVGNYGNDTWPTTGELANGTLIVEGSVGVGTINPGTYKLNVSGSIYGTSLTATNWLGDFWDSNGNPQIRIDANNNGTNYFKVNNGANSTVFQVSENGDVNVFGGKISSLAPPTLGTDAATKDYVDTAVSGATPSLNGWTFADNYFYDDGEQVIGAYDEWLRLNNASAFTNGIYTPGAFRADGKILANSGVEVDGKVAISSDNYSHEAKSTVTNRYGYFSVRNSANARGAYFGWGNGATSVDLVLESASLLNITGGNVAMSGNLAISGASLTVAGKNVCLADGTNCSPATGDNLGNHTATTNLNFGDWQAQNVNAIQLKDWDDNTGGTDSKYRLLARDGAWMFHDGGVVIGSYSNGTWSDLADGSLIVKGNVGIGTTNPVVKLHVVGKMSATSDIASGGMLSSNSLVTTDITSNSISNAGTVTSGNLITNGIVSTNISNSGTVTSNAVVAPWWTGTYWDSNTDANIRIDKDNNGTNYFKINNGANTTVFSVNEVGSVEVNPNSLGPASFKLTRSNLVMESAYPILWGSESIYGFPGNGGGITLSAGGGTGSLTVKRSGTVYINTTTNLATNQTATLEVNGVIRSKNEKPQIMVHPTSNVQYEWQFTSGRLRLNRTGTSVYADLLSFSDASGNVGIGSAPDSVAKLNVGGEVKMDRLKINMVYRSCDGVKTCSCAANEFLISGGAECDNGTIQSSYPQNNESTWFAECEYFGKKAPYRIRIYCMPGDSL